MAVTIFLFSCMEVDVHNGPLSVPSWQHKYFVINHLWWFQRLINSDMIHKICALFIFEEKYSEVIMTFRPHLGSSLTLIGKSAIHKMSREWLLTIFLLPLKRYICEVLAQSGWMCGNYEIGKHLSYMKEVLLHNEHIKT